MRGQGIKHNLSNSRWMGKIGVIHYFICMLMLCTNDICISKASYEGLSRYPLEGSRQRFPRDRSSAVNMSIGAPEFSYQDDKDLTKLLDVGAQTSMDDGSIPVVPPLDGTSPSDTLPQDTYGMKFVLFDLQLVQLKSVDAVAGSFQVVFEMILHWIDSKTNNTNDFNDTCTFLCDTDSPTPSCCDIVWVPPLHLPGCEIHKVQSSTPIPSIYVYYPPEECSNCNYWRRIWYLNIDATCESEMDFHSFPLDVQSLTIDILNPYASRTWFQLTKGFLQANINEDISNIKLAPDSKIPGWYVKKVIASNTCSGMSQSWLQTFLTQHELLTVLRNNTDARGTYNDAEKQEIANALTPENLTCPNMEDYDNIGNEVDYSSVTNIMKLYMPVRDKYAQRVNVTLENYRQCIQTKGQFFSWNTALFQTGSDKIPNFPFFNISSDQNIYRSFSILDLERDASKAYKVWFPCAISAVANLTTPGIRVTILVQRYRKFYVTKLMLPTVACVVFAFAAFGIHPRDLVGRLTVVVPSAIALTALQSLVLGTDIPPVAYTAPSTSIFIISYLFQILISFESILVKCFVSRENTMKKPRPPNALLMGSAPLGLFYRLQKVLFTPPHVQNNTHHIEMTGASSSPPPDSNTSNIETTSLPEASRGPNENSHTSCIRIVDIAAMVLLGLLYILLILIVCILKPYYEHRKKTPSVGSVTLWQN